MATIDTKKDTTGKITGYRLRSCVGRDEQGRQVWRTKTISRPAPLTPARENNWIKKYAAEWEEEVKAKFEATHSKVDIDRITLADFTRNHWWNDHVMDGSHTPSSIEFFRGMSETVLSYFGEKKALSQIDAKTIKRFIKYFNTEARTRKGTPYSPTTVQHIFGTLRNILRYARRFGYIKDDPTQLLLPKEKPHRGKKTVDFLTAEQARDFLRCLDDEPLFWKAFVNVLITCGLRRGEAVGLRWNDIDGRNMNLRIERNITLDKNSPEKYRVGDTKTGEDRTVPISSRVYGMLMALKREQEERLQIRIMPGCYIFSRPENPSVPIYPTTATAWMHKFVERHNLPPMSPHDLRHTAATLALESGANLKDVQQLLGHRDPATTMAFYAGVSEDRQRKTVEGIEAMLG